jgi:TonB family protein
MNIEATRESWVGQLVDGRFPLLQSLGSSEYSAVFLTELREQESRKAVIKLISADAGDAKTRISRWEATARLSHLHLIRLFHTGQCEIDGVQLLYVVMEFAEEDLSQILPSRPLTPAEAGEMLTPVLDVLSYLHKKGLVHGSVKPSSMRVVDNQLKLSSDSIHAPGEFGAGALESSMFDAPEATTGTMLPAADVWSLGVTLITALTQHPPTFEKSGQGEPIFSNSIPEPFHEIARKCLRRAPEDRCTIENILTLLQPTSTPLETPAGAAVASRRLIRRIKIPAAVALIVLVVFAGLRMVTRRTQAQPPLTASTTEQPNASGASSLSPTRSADANARASKGRVVQGAVAERVLPDVPQNEKNKIRGKVRVSVRVSVNPAGEVESATTKSRGRNSYLANLALQAARGWKFHPPQVNGQLVASKWILKFQFRKTETQVIPSTRHIAAHSRSTT